MALLLGLAALRCADSARVVPSDGGAEIAEASVLGSWLGSYVVHEARRVGDSRWQFGISFERDRTFECFSSMAGEERLRDRITGEQTTVPYIERHELRGSFRLVGTELLLDFGAVRLSPAESCGLWYLDRESDSILRAKITATGSGLIMRGHDNPYEVHYERQIDRAGSPHPTDAESHVDP